MTETDTSREAQIKALIDAEVVRVLAPYRAMGVPDDVLREQEVLLRIALRTHPDAQFYLRQLVRDPALDASDTVKAGDVGEAAAEAKTEGER